MSKWISIKNQLPPYYEDVLLLVTSDGHSRIFSGFLHNTFESCHSDFNIYLPSIKIKDTKIHIELNFSIWHICKQDKFNVVTHWMWEPPK